MLTQKNKIGIVDYGLGNHASLMNILDRLGFKAVLTRDNQELDSCNLIILPGVGSFNAAMRVLELNCLDDFIKNYAIKNRPIIGICLGFQLLTKYSPEFGGNYGLGLLDAKTYALPKCNTGWIDLVANSEHMDPFMIHGEHFYFNHSFAIEVIDKKIIVGYAMLLSQTSRVVAMVKQNQLVGMQFHPEKSQLAGKILLKRVIDKLIYK